MVVFILLSLWATDKVGAGGVINLNLGAVFGFLGDASLTMSVRGVKKQLGLFKENPKELNSIKTKLDT